MFQWWTLLPRTKSILTQEDSSRDLTGSLASRTQRRKTPHKRGRRKLRNIKFIHKLSQDMRLGRKPRTDLFCSEGVCLSVCVCVCNIWTDVKLPILQGAVAHESTANEATHELGGHRDWSSRRTCKDCQIYLGSVFWFRWGLWDSVPNRSCSGLVCAFVPASQRKEHLTKRAPNNNKYKPKGCTCASTFCCESLDAVWMARIYWKTSSIRRISSTCVKSSDAMMSSLLYIAYWDG